MAGQSSAISNQVSSVFYNWRWKSCSNGLNTQKNLPHISRPVHILSPAEDYVAYGYIIQNFTYLRVQYFTVSSSKHTLSLLGLINIDQNIVSNVNFFQNEISAINQVYYELSPVYKYGFYHSKMKEWCSFQILLHFCVICELEKNERLTSK